MADRWSGEAMTRKGNTPPKKVLQEETIQFKLDGTILIIEGTGKHSKGDKESHEIFKAKRNAHSAVESNINMLEHRGLNRCVDKGLPGYQVPHSLRDNMVV